MQRPKQRFVKISLKGLALGPVLSLLVFGAAQAAPTAEEARRAEAIFRKVSDAETRVVRAISAKDGKALTAAATGLGPVIEAAMARQKSGQRASACELAAHSLAFLAVSVAGSLNHSGEAKRLLVDDARTAAGNFRTDMQACEGYIGRKTGTHMSAEKALRAL